MDAASLVWKGSEPEVVLIDVQLCQLEFAYLLHVCPCPTPCGSTSILIRRIDIRYHWHIEQVARASAAPSFRWLYASLQEVMYSTHSGRLPLQSDKRGAMTRRRKRKRSTFSEVEVREHISRHHPGCPIDFADAYVQRIASRT